MTDMLFMKEISQIMTFCSMSLQRFDVLPFVVMSDINKLKLRLNAAKEAFMKGKTPEVIDIGDYKLWEFF